MMTFGGMVASSHTGRLGLGWGLGPQLNKNAPHAQQKGSAGAPQGLKPRFP